MAFCIHPLSGRRPSRSRSCFAGAANGCRGVTYEVKNPQGTAFRKFYEKQSFVSEKQELTQIFIKIQQSVQKFYFIWLSQIAHFMKKKIYNVPISENFIKKPKCTIIFSSAHSNFHQNLTVGSKDLLHTANSDF